MLLTNLYWFLWLLIRSCYLKAESKVKQSDFLGKGTGKHWGSGIMYVPTLWWCLCAALAIAPSHLWNNAHLMLEPQQWQLDNCCFWGIVLLQCRTFNTGDTGGDSVPFLLFSPFPWAAACFWPSSFLQKAILAFSKRSVLLDGHIVKHVWVAYFS